MRRILLGSLIGLVAFPAYAVDKIYTPYVHKGEWEVEYFGHRSVDNDNAKDNAQKHELSIGYGVTSWWKTELYSIWEKEPGEGTQFDALEWENIFQFTKKGEYWLDAGASLAYEWTPEDNHADAVETRLLLAKDIAATSHALNVKLEKQVGEGPRESLEAAVLWSSRYNYSPYFQPGFEIQSEFGEVDDAGDFDDQSHYIGPVAYGVIPFEVEGNHIEGLHYRAGYLFGASDAAADGELILELEYELEF